MIKQTLFLLLAAAGVCAAQNADTKTPQAFEVVSIKPSDPSAPRNGCYIRGEPGGKMFIGKCVPLHAIISWAYRVSDAQISGEPDWVKTEAWDFQAKLERPTDRTEMLKMFQSLLGERFGLKLHTEARTMPALVLTVDKNGPKMKENKDPDNWEIMMVSAGGGPPPKPPKWAGQRSSMSYLAWWFGRLQNRPGVDKTGLPGFFDFTIEFVPDNLQDLKGPNGEPGPAFDGPTMYTAVREQLGLKLESTKAPVDVMVIDHVEKASAN